MAETSDVEQLRKALHEQVDQLFADMQTGLKVEWAALQLAGKLLKAAEGWIDLNVGRELSVAATKDPEEALRLGREIRAHAKAARYRVDGQTPETVSGDGLIGASTLIGNLAAYCDDPYLFHLSDALAQHRCGQQHPWLKRRKAVAHPASSAQSALALRAIPFGVIEYLTASGSFENKTAARAAVIERLGIEEDTLRDWRKKQNRERRNDFDSMLWACKSTGKNVRGFRKRLSKIPDAQMQKIVELYDKQFGLLAVEQCAQNLKALAPD